MKTPALALALIAAALPAASFGASSSSGKSASGQSSSQSQSGGAQQANTSSGAQGAGSTVQSQSLAQAEASVKWQAPGPWYTFNGTLDADKYAQDTQITPKNVGNLQVAWTVHTGDVSHGGKVPKTDWSATPLFVNNTVYIGTPFYDIFAIAPDTGKVKWEFHTHAKLKALTQPAMKTRGVAYWQNATPQAGQPCQKIVYDGTMEGRLYAVDADTGKRCHNFGNNGVVDLNQWNTHHAKYPLSILQPPTVYKNLLFVSWAGKDWWYQEAPTGYVFALDAQTGKLVWIFNPLPPKGVKYSGTADVWASMSVDAKHGILYIPISSPSPNFYGGNRKEPIPYGTSVTALDANTGKVLWSYQLVHHDLWDYDTNSPPTLFDMQRGGKTIPALVQSSKMGFLFVLNRLTGKPLFPIREMKVPDSDVPGEQASPTQPVPVLPKPLVPDKWPGIATIGNVLSLGSCGSRFGKLRYDGWFTPPSLKGSIIYPPTTGGVEWGGGALDPRSNTYIVNNSVVAQIYKLIPRAQYEIDTGGQKKAHFYPMKGSPYGLELKNFVNWAGMPCWAPPYGRLTAIDMNTGKVLWKVPMGEVQKWGFYLPTSWGSITIGGPMITKSGLVFIGASMDSRVRAFDEKTGKLLWSHLVDAPAVAQPCTYTYKGKQYVLFTAGGNSLLTPRLSDQLIAFALPGKG